MNRYKQAREYLLAKLPAWKRDALLEDEANKRFNTRVVDEFTRSVIELAESEKIIGTFDENFNEHSEKINGKRKGKSKKI